MNKFIEAKKGEFEKTVEFFKKEISSLRTGRANPNILENVQVEAYGVKNLINALASVNVQEGQSLVVTPYDKGVIKNIEKAVVDADLGLGVVNEGDKIRLTVPKMTEENRRDLVKKLNERQEAARVSVRQTRESLKNDIEAAEESGDVAEDDKFRFLKEMDEEVGRYNEMIKTIRDKKEEEIMTI